jgi:hypothetical protein
VGFKVYDAQGREKQVASGAPVLLDKWHVVGAAGEPAFGASWRSLAGFSPVGFRKDPSGRVWLRGLVEATANQAAWSNIFTLPVGYRPPASVQFDTAGPAGTMSRVEVTASTGGVSPSAAVATSGFVILDGLSFDVEDVASYPSPLAAPFAAIYNQMGEYAGYTSYINTSQLTVDNAQSKALQWVYRPPFDVFVEFEVFVGLTQKMDANYNYTQMTLQCSPAPVTGVGGQVGNGVDIHQAHSTVQVYGRHYIKKMWALAKDTTYTMGASFGTNGGTWQYYQSPNHLWCSGKAWAR